ncbi:AAA family ATPase [Brachybacterium hainanense]|uniref:AAA family ATPase n=1 Tax=Brachybacterium hainanense TaxID=1541174 RepID=A0ABV6RDR3_9MICO
MHVLRLAGPPGVGKSTLAQAIAARFAAAGDATTHVDIDQLGMLYPAPDGDPDRWRLKERALDRVAIIHRRAGSHRLVVSGVACPDLPPPPTIACSVTSLWLDASDAQRRARLGPRGWSPEQRERTVRIGGEESARLAPGWRRLGTDDLGVEETARRILDLAAQAEAKPLGPTPLPEGADSQLAPVLWITGPRCTGASSIGWQLAQEAWAAGRRLGFLDLAQLSLARNLPGGERAARVLGADCAASLHECFVAAGGTASIVVAPLDAGPELALAAFGDVPVIPVRLDASAADLRARARSRADGGGPVLAGDDLREATPFEIAAVVRRALHQRMLPLRPGEIRVSTTGADVPSAAARIRTATGWSA